MTTSTSSSELAVRKAPVRISGYPPSTMRFDWLITGLTFMAMLGVYLDGWAHNTYAGKIESFLTPWHAVLYGGVLLSGVALCGTCLRNVRRGYSPTSALPQGYMLSLVGFGIIMCSGVVDSIWHAVFGFEVDVEAMLSPAHLFLASGALLMMSGPLRSAWRATEERRGWVPLLPGLISLLSVMSLGTFFTQYSNIMNHGYLFVKSARPDRSNLDLVWMTQISAVSHIIIPAVIIMTFLLFAIHRWEMPAGSFTFLIAANAGLVFLQAIRVNGQNWQTLVGAVVGGIIADVLYVQLKPSVRNPRGLRLWAFLATLFLYVSIFGSLLLTKGVWWAIHMWLGVPIEAAAICLGISFLMAPPAIPGQKTTA